MNSEITTILTTLKATEDMLKSARKKIDAIQIESLDAMIERVALLNTCRDYEHQVEKLKQGFAQSHGIVLQSEN
jgi:hypothetical protein